MQLLYARRLDQTLTPESTMKAYNTFIEDSYRTLLFDLYLFTQVLSVATGERKRKSKKLRPTEADKAFVAHIHDNPLVKALRASPELKDVALKHDFDALVKAEHLRGFYEAATSFPSYEEYATQPTASNDAHLKALLKAHKSLMGHEAYTDYLEDRFARWTEDESLVVGAVKKILKSLPASAAFVSTYRPDEETRVAFGHKLLSYCLESDSTLQAHIEPVLQNWDAERVALVDMICIKMALAEFLSFSKIPPKVTLNEYVELAKLYSTPKSKEFINGVLDRLLHSLRGEGLIVKEGRGLIE